MKIDTTFNITKNEIFDKIGEEAIFERYLGIFPEFNKTFKNPLRNDDSAGCRFYTDQRGIIKFNDLSKRYNWDCINVVQFKFNLSFYDALQKIAEDFNLVAKTNNKTVNKVKQKTFAPPVIEVFPRRFRKSDLEFWKYLKKEQLVEIYNVVPVDRFHLYSKGVKNTFYCSSYTVFAYLFGDLPDGRQDIKLYFPYKKEDRFIHNDSIALQGRHLIEFNNNNCLITKSYKDVIYAHTLGIESVATKAETIYLTENQYKILNDNYIDLYSLFDNDTTGRMAAIYHYKKYDIQPLMFPKTMGKDLTDNLFDVGYDKMKDIIKYSKYRYGIE